MKDLAPAVLHSLDLWHQMLVKRDLSALSELIAPSAIFRSPMAHKPYEGGASVALILRTVFDVFEDFAYHRQFACGRQDVVLEFSARVGDKELKGIDMIAFDENGKIIEFEVMIRPASALMALGEIMARTGAVRRS